MEFLARESPQSCFGKLVELQRLCLPEPLL